MQEMWVRSLGQEMATHFSILIWEIPGQIEFQRYTDGQQAHRKMLNITNHQGNANQNHNEISPHTCQNGYYFLKNVGEDVEKGNTWDCRLVQPVRKTVWRFLKILRLELPYIPAIPLMVIELKEMKSLS